MFELSLRDTEDNCFNGAIQIDGFYETFLARSNYYKKHDYYQSWLMTVDQLLKENKSYFLVDVGNPKSSNWFNSWTIYQGSNLIYIQNKLLFSKDHNLCDVINFKIQIDDLSFENECGEKISTWKMDMNSLLSFYQNLKNIIVL